MSDEAIPLPPPADPSPSRLCADAIKRSWLEGTAPDTEAALHRHPELQADKSVVLDLAYEEYCLRREAGENLDPDAFADRFPDFRTSLRKLLAAHHFLDDNAHLLEHAAAVRWPRPGEQHGDLTLLRELGRGAFARVFLATEATTGDRPVAVKFSAESSAEARTLGRLEHANIVPILSARPDPSGLTIICMPYLGQATLQELLANAYPTAQSAPPRSAEVILEAARLGGRPGDPPVVNRSTDPALLQADYVEGVLHLGIQLAEALQFIHERGVCHRDLKPSNVLLDAGGRPMLLDFNLSADDLRSQFRAGGTLPYMAPEQLRWMEGIGDEARPQRDEPELLTAEKEAAFTDPRADLFALGVLLYELLTGKHPFGPVPRVQPGADIAVWLVQRQREGCRPLRGLNPRVSAPAARWIERCLAWSADARPATAAELAAGLRRHFAAPARLRRWVGRHARSMTAAAALAILGIGAGAWAAAQRPPQQMREHAAGMRAFQAGDLDRAERHFTAALAADRTHAESWYEQGRVHAARGDMTLALPCFEEKRKLRADGLTLAYCAYCLGHKGDHREAILRGDEACAAGFATAAVRNNRAFSRLQLGDLAGAADDLAAALAIAPDLLAARYNRAHLALRESEDPLVQKRLPLQALDDFLFVLERVPKQAELLAEAARFHAAASANSRDELADRAIAFIRQARAAGKSAAKLRRNALLSRRLSGHPAYPAVFDEPIAEAVANGSQDLPLTRLRLSDPGSSGEP